MTYSRKPKNIHAFIQQMHSAQAHSWESAEAEHGVTPSIASAGVDIQTRSKREASRQTVGGYQRSQLANMATSQRGRIVEYTQKNRQILQQRLDADSANSSAKPLAHKMQTTPSRLSERPVPSPSLYPRAPF